MNKRGYIAYLESLGNQKHYIGQIQELKEMEHALGIDLDDYIPFDDNYSKVAELDRIMPEEMRFNERLAFSINSYMRYRLSDYERKLSVDAPADYPLSGDIFSFSGSKAELIKRLRVFMNEADADSFIEGVRSCAYSLEEDESIEVNYIPDEKSRTGSERFLSFLVGESNYNINIKALTLVAIALLLDIKLTLGVASSVLAIMGFNGQAIARIDASEGEKCLILEAIHSKNRIINEDVLSECNSECVHHDLDCRYRIDDKCTIKKEKIRSILDDLCTKNIFRRIGNLYKYNF